MLRPDPRAKPAGRGGARVSRSSFVATNVKLQGASPWHRGNTFAIGLPELRKLVPVYGPLPSGTLYPIKSTVPLPPGVSRLSLQAQRPKISCSATTAGEARRRGKAVFYADNFLAANVKLQGASRASPWHRGERIPTHNSDAHTSSLPCLTSLPLSGLLLHVGGNSAD